MEQKIFTIAILGVGARGADAYGTLINAEKDKFKIVALCDLRQHRLDVFGEKFGVPVENRFLDETEFFKEKRADLLLVATQDKDHVRHCVKGFELGYHLMTEKPLTDRKEECQLLLDAQKKSGKQALVCHVLRYAPAFLKANEILKSGAIGKLVAVTALERVAFWHQAHSYVRGNWRNDKDASPMILAKCCHDLDLLQWYVGAKCKSVSSMGDLVYFKPENAPEGATAYCVDCPHKQACPYNAEQIYIENWKKKNCPEDIWPYNVAAKAPVNEEKLRAALQDGPYGRCVYHCDNNVVDHQLTTMTFENGVKATLTMTGFTAGSGRRFHFHGTLGELLLDEADNQIVLHKYGKDAEIIRLEELEEGGYAHGGGDFFLIKKLYEIMQGNAAADTTLEASVESHLMGICAEESRLNGGKLVLVHE